MSKSKVFLFVENATSSFLRFHSGTERFFEKKKKDANYRNAIILFILSVTVLTFLFYLTSFDLTTVNIFLVMAESQGYLVHGLLRAVFSNLSLFLTSAVIYFLVLTKGFKIKINFVQILYFYGLIVSVSAIANVLFLLSSVMQEYVSSSIPGMGVLVISILAMVVALVVALYLMLTAFKVLSSLSYKKTILALIVVAIIAGMLLPFVLLFTTVIQWTILGSGNPPTYYYYNVTANTDGSITATYAWMLNSTNKPKEICYVGFPKGWVLAEYDITSMVVLAERNRTVESYDMSDVFINQILVKGI